MIGHGNYFIKKYDYIKKRPWDVWIKSSHGRCNDWLCVFVLRKMPTESGYCLFEPDAWMTIRLDVLYTNAYNEMVVSLYTSLNENKRMRFMKIFFPTNCFFHSLYQWGWVQHKQNPDGIKACITICEENGREVIEYPTVAMKSPTGWTFLRRSLPRTLQAQQVRGPASDWRSPGVSSSFTAAASPWKKAQTAIQRHLW